MPILNSTPRADGYMMPAEWQPHSGCLMLLPQRPDNWRDEAIPAQAAFAQVAQAIARFEPATVGVSESLRPRAESLLGPNIRIVNLESDDAWMRDVGPTFVVNGQGGLRGVDWIFNAWGGHLGGLYPSWERDDAVTAGVCEDLGVARYRADFVLDGGAIHVDGEGTLLTTRQCLLNPNRNPHLTQTEIEQRLADYLSVERIIWLDDGVYLDETDGHIDNLACFVRPGEVLLTWTDDPRDPQYAISRAAYDILMDSADARGRRLIVHRIHQPGPLTVTAAEAGGVRPSSGTQPRRSGDRMAASYVNFYIANGGIVMPLYDDPYDSPALAQMRSLFPDRAVVGIPAREILLGGGSIHCITQQIPHPHALA
jgi:agmatine deiminase